MLKSSTEHRILGALPNDRPITAIQIVENISKCPRGFVPIYKTYDQDQDADLRESSIFKSSAARYLCVSKTEGLPNFVIQDICVGTEKFNPPKGFSVVNKTVDSEQKAWRKKQIFYRLVNIREAKTAITDIIICSRLKKAPDGFRFAGELNGVTICFKMGNVQDGHHGGSETNGGHPAPTPPPRGAQMYPDIEHDYEILKPPGYPLGPTRPAPRPPPPVPTQNSTGTLGGGGFSNLDGVPFVVNPKFVNSATVERFQFPVIRAKTMQQLMNDYDYPFTVERQT